VKKNRRLRSKTSARARLAGEADRTGRTPQPRSTSLLKRPSNARDSAQMKTARGVVTRSDANTGTTDYASSSQNGLKNAKSSRVVSVVTKSRGVRRRRSSTPDLGDPTQTTPPPPALGGQPHHRPSPDDTEQKKEPTPAEILKRITVPQPTRRFLQSWNPDVPCLYFGVSDGRTGVLVYANNQIKVARWGGDDSALVPSRLLQPTVVRLAAMPTAPAIHGADLFDRVRAVLSDYVHFDDPRVLDLLTVWIIGTYVYALFSHYGYLFFHSKLPRSGKTRTLEVLSHLAFNATTPLNGPTAPVIRDLASEGNTVVLDTLERWKEKAKEGYAALMELLDAGFRNGGTMSIKESTGGNKWVRRDFPVFAPYAMAGINRRSLTDTALDRAFVIEMSRKQVAVKTRAYKQAQCEQTCEPIRNDLYVWALQQAPRVDGEYGSVTLEGQVDRLGLHDRAADIWKPLFALARALMLPPAVVERLSTLAKEIGGGDEAAEDAQKLLIVRALLYQAEEEAPLRGMTSDILAIINARGVSVKHDALTALLSSWGFVQSNQRLPGKSDPRRAWTINAARLRALEQELTGAPPDAVPVPIPPETVTTLTTATTPTPDRQAA
jgi:hypothetical protein